MTKPATERVGIFGGTFNPIHYGHLRAAEEIREHFKLSTVIFVPAHTPPHKERASVASCEHRLKMVQSALDGNPSFACSDFELTREQTSYSIVTIKYFRTQRGSDQELFFLMGMDSFLEIHTWKDYTQMFSLTNIVVMTRPGFPEREPNDVLPVDVASDFDYNSSERAFVHVSGHRLYIHHISLLDISSSEIRRRVGRQRSIRYLVPETVERYITRHALYRG